MEMFETLKVTFTFLFKKRLAIRIWFIWQSMLLLETCSRSQQKTAKEKIQTMLEWETLTEQRLKTKQEVDFVAYRQVRRCGGLIFVPDNSYATA